MFFSLFYTIQKHAGKKPLLSLWNVWVIVMICAVLWEVVENVFFIQIGLKFEGRLDSWQNMTTDILLVGLGGIGAWIVCYILVSRQKKLLGYYIFGIVSFALWIGVFLILRWLTYWNTPVFS